MSDPHGIIGIYRKGKSMTKTEVFNEVINTIYQDNFGHVDFMDNMGGEDCDCSVHITLNTILEYWEK